MDIAGPKTIAKITVAIGLWAMVQLFLNSLDRGNVAYAALQMNAELGFDPKIYGFGVGLFFVGHILCLMPGAALARRFGPAPVISCMIIVWGSLAAALGFIHKVTGFYTLRFLLGATEAGAGPTVILLMSLWIPKRAFARVMTFVTIATPVGQFFGAPFSGGAMTLLDGAAGLSGWRWMFFVEGGLTILFGWFTLVWLRDCPGQAAWLEEDERNALTAEIAQDAKKAEQQAGLRSREGLRDIVSDPYLWLCSAIVFSIALGVFAMMFWLPQLIALLQATASTFMVTLLSGVPWIGMGLGSLLFGLSSDRTSERSGHLIVAMLVGAGGLLLASSTASVVPVIIGLTVAAAGLGGATTVFWTIPPAYLAGARGAAFGFAMINVVASLSGVVGPNLIGWMRVQTGSFSSALHLLLSALLVGACLVAVLRHREAKQLAVNAQPVN